MRMLLKLHQSNTIAQAINYNNSLSLRLDKMIAKCVQHNTHFL
jgi:hypothetical protein